MILIFITFSVVTSDDEHITKPKRLRKKRKKKEDETEEDIIDGFSIRCFKTYSHLQQFNYHEISLLPDDITLTKKEESTETSSLNAHEESYVCNYFLFKFKIASNIVACF